MKKITLLYACFTLGLWFPTSAQDIHVLKDGILTGTFEKVEGAEGGKSIHTSIQNKVLQISFDGEESWGRAFLTATAPLDLKNARYMSFKIKADSTTVWEELGCGERPEQGERIKKITLTKEWTTIVMKLPPSLQQVKVPFVIASIKKATIDIAFITFTQEQPTTTGKTLLLLPSKVERLENAKYVYSDKIEYGAPSGYAGENNGASMLIDDHCMENPYRGRYCMKFTIDESESWRALFLQAMGKWTGELNDSTKLASLKDYKKLVFYARSPQKGYIIPEIGFGSSTNRFSQEPRSLVYVTLQPEWQRYELDIRGLDRKSVNDVMTLTMNSGTFYLDEIRFEK